MLFNKMQTFLFGLAIFLFIIVILFSSLVVVRFTRSEECSPLISDKVCRDKDYIPIDESFDVCKDNDYVSPEEIENNYIHISDIETECQS